MAKSMSREELEQLTDRVKRSRSIAQQQHSKWKDLYDYYEGEGQKKAFALEDQEKWVQQELRVANFVFSIVRTTVPILLDSAPEWYVVNDSAELQDKISDYLQAYYHRRMIRTELRMALEDAVILGTGALKIRYDKDIGEQGDVAITWQDPFCIFPDTAADRLEDCEFVALLNEYSEQQAQRLFDGEGAYAKIDVEEAAKSEWTGATRPGKERVSSETEELIEVWEVYHEFGKKLTIYTGEQVLYSGPNPLGERWPVVLFTPQRNPRDIWGSSDVTQLQDVQNDINLLRLRFNINARLTANPQVAIYGDPNQEVSNTPGHAYKFTGTKQEAGIERLGGLTLPSDLWSMMSMNREALDVISGVQNVTRGRREPGVQAGVAIQALQEASLTRPREIIRDVAISFELVGQIALECMQANYTNDRTMSHMTQEGMSTGEVSPDELSQPVTTENVGLVGKAKAFFGLDEELRAPKKLRVVVQTGGDMPMSQAQRADQAIRLFQLESIDRKALLEEVNFPNRQQIDERMEAREQEMMQAQMQQQMMQMQGAQQGQMPQEQDMGESTMPPEQAIHILQQALEPDDIVALIEIREALIAQRPLDEEQEELLQRLTENPQLAEAVEAFLMAEYEPEEMEQEGAQGGAPQAPSAEPPMPTP